MSTKQETTNGSQINSEKQIRYGVVGLGWIAQEVVLPAFENVGNSQLTALITDDPEKAKELKEAYSVEHTYSYKEFDRFLKDGVADAVYIALPNSMHAEYAIRAAEAGLHVLCEKPIAGNLKEAESMTQSAEKVRVKLMVAYRLHFESANLSSIQVIQSGTIGEPKLFNAVFSQQVKPGDVRLRTDLAGGALMDLGVYPINASRFLFRDEPIEVSAFGARPSGDERFREVDESVAVLLRFPNNRLASFSISMGAGKEGFWEMIGTKGSLRLESGFDYHKKMSMLIKTDEEEEEIEQEFSRYDQFGGEIEYFSECILQDMEPEPSGREGIADLRIVEAAMESMKTGRAVKLDPFEVNARPEKSQEKKLLPLKAKKIVHAAAPTA